MMVKQVRVLILELPSATAGSSAAAGSRVKELLADADPFIAGLIKKLQNEVKTERATQSLVNRFRQRGLSLPRSEAPWPSGEPAFDFELPDLDFDFESSEDENDWPLFQDLERFE